MGLAQGSFQQQVNRQPAPAVAGDWAGSNIRTSVLAPPGGYVAAPNGVVVGNMAWGNPATGVMSNYYQPNSLYGIPHRANQGLITIFLAPVTMAVAPGYPVDAENQADMWGYFPGGGTIGQKVYANPLTGALTAAATGEGLTAGSTASSLAATGILTVGATLSGTITVGMVVTGAGIPAGLYVGSQLSGTTGSTGTYQLVDANGVLVSGTFPVVASEQVNFQGVYETRWSLASNVDVAASFTGVIAATTNGPSELTTSGVTGTILVGDTISGTGVPPNTVIQSQVSGTVGGAGVYIVNTGLAVASTAMTSIAGQLGRITTWNN
jgi:hypothetical protein